MKKHAILIAFGLMISAQCLSQQAGWKTEHHDTMVVPPNATDVSFRERGFQDELTYTVDEPYPAQNFVDGLCEQMRLKGWHPGVEDVCTKPEWEKVPPWQKVPSPSAVKYRVSVWFGKSDDDHPNGETASYDLEYRIADDERHPHTLHVDVWAIHSEPAPLPRIAPAKPSPPILSKSMIRFVSLFLYLLVLVGIVRLLTLTRVRSALFFAGEGATLTTTNLVLTAPSFLVLLSIGVMLLVAVFSADENFARDGVLGIAVLGWVFLAFCAVVAVVASPIVIILTVAILYSDTFPRNVKIGHAVLGLLSLSFWVVCIACFSGPLMHW